MGIEVFIVMSVEFNCIRRVIYRFFSASAVVILVLEEEECGDTACSSKKCDKSKNKRELSLLFDCGCAGSCMYRLTGICSSLRHTGRSSALYSLRLTEGILGNSSAEAVLLNRRHTACRLYPAEGAIK